MDVSARLKTMRRKQNSASAFGIQKENWGCTMLFSEIIKLQFGKKTPYIALYFTAFSNNYCCLFVSKKCMVTLNFLFGFQ